MGFIKKYFANRTVTFYVAFGLAVISVVTAVIYAAVFGDEQEYMSWIGFVLMLSAGLSFFALSIFGFEKWGIAAMSLLDFAALLVSALVTYHYFVGFAINGGIGAAFADAQASLFVVCVILLILCCIGGNVTAWFGVRKKSAESDADKGEEA